MKRASSSPCNATSAFAVKTGSHLRELVLPSGQMAKPEWQALARRHLCVADDHHLLQCHLNIILSQSRHEHNKRWLKCQDPGIGTIATISARDDGLNDQLNR